MSNVITLPVGAERFWNAELGPQLKAVSMLAGIPSAGADEILANLKARYLTLAKAAEFSIPVSSESQAAAQAAMDAIGPQIASLLGKATLKMHQLETLLWLERNDLAKS